MRIAFDEQALVWHVRAAGVIDRVAVRFDITVPMLLLALVAGRNRLGAR
jgi:hypothetical protein